MIKIIKNYFSILALLIVSVSVCAQNTSPVGTWRSIDDETGEPKSIIQITDKGGKLEGKIIELLNPSEPNPLCDKCEGERANQPITGMVILWEVTQKGEGKWGGGKILDPKKGKTYKVNLNLKDDGASLKVRGYIGAPMLGRTQVWERVE